MSLSLSLSLSLKALTERGGTGGDSGSCQQQRQEPTGEAIFPSCLMYLRPPFSLFGERALRSGSRAISLTAAPKAVCCRRELNSFSPPSLDSSAGEKVYVHLPWSRGLVMAYLCSTLEKTHSLGHGTSRSKDRKMKQPSHPNRHCCTIFLCFQSDLRPRLLAMYRAACREAQRVIAQQRTSLCFLG